MGKIKKVIASAWGLLSAYMILNGLAVFFGTSGNVQGSEFGMLIRLANQLSLIMLWLALFAIHALCPDGDMGEGIKP